MCKVGKNLAKSIGGYILSVCEVYYKNKLATAGKYTSRHGVA